MQHRQTSKLLTLERGSELRAPLDSTIGEEFENTRLPLGYFRGGKLPEPGRSQPCRCARQLRFAPTRDLFGSGRHPAEPPRGTSFWFWATPGRPARPTLNVDLAWTPLCLPKLGTHYTHSDGHEQNAVDFSTGLGPHQAWTPLCLHSHIIRPHSS